MAAKQKAIQSDEEAMRSYASSKGVDLSKLPEHIAIIMDGNGRWAQKRGLPRLLGHRQGYINLRTVVRDAADIGIKALSLYVFSAENWRRPQDETKGLMKLIEQAAIDELRSLHQNGVKIRYSGRTETIPQSLLKALEDGRETTKNNTRLVLNLCINYGGRSEIIDAIRTIAQDFSDKKITSEQIDEHLVSDRLYSVGLPDPDLLIRTAGEMRISNFLLWQIAYSELYVTETLWPDFNKDVMIDAIKNYQKRVRKFGGVV